jgi:post-segregation antitoxin (ccd killing protein)
MSNQSNIRVNINVSPEIHEYYKDLARRAGISMSAAMSIALLRYMESEQDKKK